MNNILNISGAASLGLHTVQVLAAESGRRMGAAEIARRLKVSGHHLAKVLQRLVRAGILDSVRGPSGGFMLAADSGGRTLLDVYQAVEGPLPESGCLLGHRDCLGDSCLFGDLLGQTKKELQRVLGAKTIARLGRKREKRS
jgi:Rrf2 family protein